ncbi:MAG: D-aminoacylase [Ignavibacterium sp.]|nr:D-aminoacylase [Ignavibacterium sp.]
MSDLISRKEFIKKSSGAVIAVGLAGGVSTIISGCSRPALDLLIKNGSIIDGTGKSEFPADIGIRDGKIVAIENYGIIKDDNSLKIIDAKYLKVTPGFIDIHSHTDTGLFINPNAESKIRQGVTTEVAGQDGSSVAPRKNNSDDDDEYEEGNKSWSTSPEFFKLLEENKTAVNFVTFVGQGTLRGFVVGQDDRIATSEEIEQMKKLAMEAFDQGVFGISSGLEYTPGSFASTEEISELCKVMKNRGGIYATHMRNEADTVLEAITEAIQIGKAAGVPVNISHLKLQGKANWNKIDQALALIEDANNNGRRVTFDRYPYTAFSTGLSNLFPLWSRDGGRERFLERLQNTNDLIEIKKYVLDKVASLSSWDAVLIAGVKKENNKQFEGKTIQQITSESKEDPFEFTRKLLIDENGSVSMCGFGMSEENTSRILSHPLCMVASDASARATYGKLSEGSPHPRSYGTFPRFLGRYVRQNNIVTLPEAIRKITSFPAETLGISNRGVIAKGKMADVVCFDYENIIDKSDYVNPHQYSQGVQCVVVNGELVIDQSEHTGKLPGQILRKS